MENKKIEYSEYQKKIFSTYVDTNQNIVVTAVPGAGKTFVLEKLSKLTNHSLESIFLAFNKSITEELEKKLPSHVQISTLHSLGCKSLFYNFSKLKINNWKTYQIVLKISKNWKEDIKSKNKYYYDLVRLYDFYRLSLSGSSFEQIKSIGNTLSILVNNMMYNHFLILLSQMNKYNIKLKLNSDIDFIDMIYLPVYLDLSLKKYDRIFVDECQDFNQCQHQLVNKLKKFTTRIVAVGQEQQGIYGFMGADSLSFKKFQEYPNTITLPLSVTYRCGKSIVQKANEVFSDIENLPNMHEGEVIEEGSINDILEGDFCLCRNNKPLIDLYFKLIVQNKKVYIKGNEIGKDLIELIEPMSSYSIDYTILQLQKQLEDLAYELLDQGVKDPKNHKSYGKFQENILILQVFGNHYEKVSEVLSIMDNIFKEEGEGITLMSIHKSKGLEANNVFILFPNLMPSKYALTEIERQQEKHIQYVAYTRAKNKLVFINKLD